MSKRNFIALVLSFPFKMLFYVLNFGRVKFGKRVIINWRFKFRGSGRLIIEDDVNMWAHKEWNEFFTYSKDSIIKIGSCTRLNGITIQCRKSVEIGERCLIGSAMIIDNDFHSIYPEHRNDLDYIKSESIFVGDDVWIAGQSVILKGVNIGKRSVVAMRAVVTKNVEENTVVAGNPAMVVKSVVQI